MSFTWERTPTLTPSSHPHHISSLFWGEKKGEIKAIRIFKYTFMAVYGVQEAIAGV